KSLSQKKVKVIFSDARRWVERAREKYDVIIVNLPDPVNARINRMYTQEFFYFAKERLNPGGIFAFSISVSENYINREAQSLIACLYETVNSVFRDVIIIPGELLFYIASDKKGILTQDVAVLEKRVKERNLDLKYVRQYYLADCLSPWRIKYFEDSINELSHVRINTDYSPVCYYYGEVYWSTLFTDWFRRLLVESGKIKLWWFLAIPGLLFVLRIFIKKPTGFPVLFAVFSSGFAEIMFQVLIIVMFQVYYGYLYYRLGILITFFMIGLVIGAYVAGKINTGKTAWQVFVLSQIGMCIYPLLLPLIFLSMRSIGGTSSWYWEYMVFPILPVIAGFVGGIQFPLANRLYLKKQKGLIGKVSGLTYGLDVFGSFFGALIGSAILIPLLGIFQSCVAASIISTSALVSLFIFKDNR
ncbi:MAG: hypothetical protein KAQ99_00370, partial [Candidatus Aureabacteria bacterium]|nr:hypothetical protein [Candidatus Auribacterota bacterium]